MLFGALLAACASSSPGRSGPSRERLWPFPNAWLVEDGRLNLEEGELPQVETAWPVHTLAGRRGFSAAQTVVIDLGAVPTGLPGPEDAVKGAAVQVWDLDEGVQLSAWAEVDASPDSDGETPVLLVRPGEPWPVGHEVAVVLGSTLVDEEGAAIPSPEWFTAALAGRPAEGQEQQARDTRTLVRRLAGYGVEDPILAFSFPIDDGGALLDAMIAEVGVPAGWTWTGTADADEGASLPEGTWKQLSGTLPVPWWLDEAGLIAVDDRGAPVLQGEGEARLFVHLPASVREAEPGTVPVWFFGHGIFSTPETYLSDLSDPSGVVEVAGRAGAILVATRWEGLTSNDLLLALGAASDIGRLPEIPAALAQSQVAFAALVRLVTEGGLLDDPLLEGLPDPDRFVYYGISLGGIQGAVALARAEVLEHAVLHAGGSAWSTMLERSYAFATLEPFVVDTLPSARDRQLVYAASQLWWDPVDPATVADRLEGRSVLWQEVEGDEFVPNLSTRLLARGAGAVVLEPYVELPRGLSSGPAPLQGAVLSQFDPELGRPDEANRPADRTGAHATPRLWEGAQAQTLDFLAVEDPGTAESFCGSDPCTAANTGDP